MIRKFFKLDEPLGRAGFIIGSALVFVFIFFLDFIFKFSVSSLFFENLYWFFIIPFSIKRLKDIGKSKNLVWIFLFQTIIFSTSKILVSMDLSSGGYSVQDLVFDIAVIFTLICLIFFLYLVLSAGKIAEEKKSAMIIDRVFLWVCVFGFFAFLIGSCQYEIYQSKKTAMKVVEAVDKFQAEKGHYPEKMEELIPDYIAEIPKVKGGFISKGLFYRLYENHEMNNKDPVYCVGFMYFVRHVYYCSDERVWGDSD